MVRWIDIPPVWLAGFAALAWLQAERWPMGLSFGGPWADFAGGLLVGAGLLLVVFAFMEFQRHRTTIIPHREAERLITSGIFKRSRNPIYLADVLILAGLILRWDAVLALPLVPILFWLLETRFVIPEENRLRRRFRADFARYCQRTRRWM
ncbi:MAG: methyltransferase [Roseovarius sp.]